MKVRTQCPECLVVKMFELDENKVKAWHEGDLIQNVFPELSNSDRDRLISGFCDTCWYKLMRED